ncbi:acyl-[acyl-carrier-protein] thioesterase [Dysgonomonas sp. 520]|uniref:acyl-[acyl-carrier-protein] thioesterase n=1 Tax=Dysgonomonas sp. 520 TaxID=2302931 RepID=UPI0013D75DA0|nr:acyl-ACP thioesterase domain-containing protein [Dysgonomonas sp. 520]NDW08180.1 acyl-[acyl-carrier-protein] thioesterase [Dysgonomonas sp. 520]
MKEIVGTYPYTIDAYLSDFRGKATLPMIGGFMLQAATRHAEERGFGYSAMTGQNKVWVLIRMAIEIFEYPKNDTTIRLNTWVADVNKMFTERCFSFEDENGKMLGCARSVWTAIDMQSRRPTNLTELEGLSDFANGNPAPVEAPGKIPLLKDDATKVTSFDVKYSDIDINKHLNSMKYIEHFVDIFPLSMYQEKEIRRFEITYIQEGHYGSTLDILEKKDAQGVSILEMKSGDKAICSAKVIWE